ncbi:MAG: T9SS type A sorting domain-containing protein [Bacteroidetes bacterium]|nr:T9SS type A sorting domain-containing protein [Bacteroidota bacterium]
MKTKILSGILMAFLASVPQVLTAQWNMVRFDEYNNFNKAFTASPQTAFVGGTNMTGPGSFLLRTNDGGTTWDSINFSTSLATTNLYHMSFTDVNNGFIGGINNNNQILMSTTDNGSTWNTITPDPSSSLPIISISFINQLEGFASNESEIFKTTDGGVTWVANPSPLIVNTIAFTDMFTGFAGGTTGTLASVFKTTDGGQTWSNLIATTNAQSFVNAMKKLDVINSNVIYSSLEYSNKIFKTSNSGLTWDTISISPINTLQDFDFINATDGHALSSMGEIYGTTDGGLTWNFEYAVSGGVYGPSVFLSSLSFSGTTGYVCGTSGLIKKFTDGTTGMTNGNSILEQVTLFPNPTAKGNEISMSGMEGNYTIEIVNSVGQLVVKQDLYAEGSNSVHKIMPILSSGIYSVSLFNGHECEILKLVVY